MSDPVSTAVLEATDQVAFCADTDTTLRYLNPAFLRLLGLDSTPPDLKLVSLTLPTYVRDLERDVQAALEGRRLRTETAIRARDGETVFFEGTLTATRLDGTEVIVGILRDISDRKRAEDVLSHQAGELMKASETLDRKDQEIAEALEQAKKYQEEHERAVELAAMNQELEAEVKRRAEAENTLRASLEEKEILLKEVHHRVKNNMQVISSLLNLQVNEIDDEAARKLFLESQSRIRSMALVHEKLYQSDDLASVDFPDYVDSLARTIFRTNAQRAARIRLDIDIEPVSLPLDQAIPCGLLINELVSNALKHAFDAEGGTLTLRLTRNGDSRELLVSDDGVGLPPDFDPDTTDTLGLRLVHSLVAQMEGSLRIADGKGTAFSITFPCSDA